MTRRCPTRTCTHCGEPPYYAFQIILGDLGTSGGLRTDEYARVLRGDDSVIDGLYATGNTAAAVMGRSYAGAGATIGPAMTFGYVAAKHIVRTTEDRPNRPNRQRFDAQHLTEATMKISLFYEFALPRPWAPDDERPDVRSDGLDEVELADKAGFSTVWLTEHHFLEEYCHSTAPEMFLAAASQRTKDIRLGFGIMHLPPAVNHPARVAERVVDAGPDLRRPRRIRHG